MEKIRIPIVDFVKSYGDKEVSRLHMPGHKGQCFLGCEKYDITEISGADALYEADGIIAESESCAASLFGSAKTLYSTEGSSQCIRAMLYLVILEWKRKQKKEERPIIVAARNVHKSFIYAAALLDFDVIWLWPEESDSICACPVTVESLRKTLCRLKNTKNIPAAVFMTSPDYLGCQQDLAGLADLCHEYGTMFAVDNAHGAYLHFIEPRRHPMDLGADLCCDSAHKTLPVLTGGAYLHIGKNAPGIFCAKAKDAMALFGSTSPSYLILSSLDLCNGYLQMEYTAKLKKTIEQVRRLRTALENRGWECFGTEPLKLTVKMPRNTTGLQMAEKLRTDRVECEYADREYLVLMFTPENDDKDYERLRYIFGKNTSAYTNRTICWSGLKGRQRISIRQAVFSEYEEIPVEDAVGRICAATTVACPPAVPIVVSGEEISGEAIELFEYYDIRKVAVLLRKNI